RAGTGNTLKGISHVSILKNLADTIGSTVRFNVDLAGRWKRSQELAVRAAPFSWHLAPISDDMWANHKAFGSVANSRLQQIRQAARPESQQSMVQRPQSHRRRDSTIPEFISAVREDESKTIFSFSDQL